MVISKTPFRMSFFGGGTDFEDYFKTHHGAVLSTTFDKYCYVIVRHLPGFFDYKTELAYSRIERVKETDEILHPAIRNAMKLLDIAQIRLTYEADLPARSGLGTSSSFAVGMLNAFYALKGQHIGRKKLADEAIRLERSLCGEEGGWQDQIAAAFGGFNRIDFHEGGYEVSPVIISPGRKKMLNESLMLFFTGFSRNSADIQRLNKITDEKNHEVLQKMYELVEEAESILTDENRDLDDFGKLLDLTWKMKKKTGKVITTESVERIYKKGIEAGALGGKLLGAGGGGFILFYVPYDRQKNVKKALNDLLCIPFEFENSGSRVIYYTPEKEFRL